MFFLSHCNLHPTLKELKLIDRDGEELPDSHKKTAIKCILPKEAKEHFSAKEEDYETYDEFRNAIMKWAMRKRLEYNQDHAPMDCGMVEGGNHSEDHSQQYYIQE